MVDPFIGINFLVDNKIDEEVWNIDKDYNYIYIVANKFCIYTCEI